MTSSEKQRTTSVHQRRGSGVASDMVGRAPWITKRYGGVSRTVHPPDYETQAFRFVILQRGRPRSRAPRARPARAAGRCPTCGAGAPETYQSEPLSATIRPYSLNAWATIRAWRGRPEMSTPAFSRSRSPIRGSAGSVSEEAKWRAGKTKARRLCDTVMRSACVMRPCLHLLVAGEQRQDRQARRVGARPARRAQLRLAQAPGRARARRPAAALLAQGEQLEQLAAVAVDEQRVAVAVGLRPALDPARRAGSGSARGRTRPRSRSAPSTASSRRVTTS